MSEELWYPPQQDGFGPWIEHTRNCRPVSKETVVEVLLSFERDNQRWTHAEGFAEGFAGAYRWLQDIGECNIVAYCVKIDQ